MDFNPDTWGTVADWVGGLGTTAAFVATFVVIRRDAAVRREQQARQVAYYLRRPDGTPFDGLADAAPTRVDYFVSNLSPEPIYDVVHFYPAEGKAPFGLLDYRTVVLPNSEFKSDHSNLDGSEHPLVHFRDNSGNVWIRGVAGDILQVRRGTNWTAQNKFPKQLRALKFRVVRKGGSTPPSSDSPPAS